MARLPGPGHGPEAAKFHPRVPRNRTVQDESVCPAGTLLVGAGAGLIGDDRVVLGLNQRLYAGVVVSGGLQVAALLK